MTTYTITGNRWRSETFATADVARSDGKEFHVAYDPSDGRLKAVQRNAGNGNWVWVSKESAKHVFRNIELLILRNRATEGGNA